MQKPKATYYFHREPSLSVHQTGEKIPEDIQSAQSVCVFYKQLTPWRHIFTTAALGESPRHSYPTEFQETNGNSDNHCGLPNKAISRESSRSAGAKSWCDTTKYNSSCLETTERLYVRPRSESIYLWDQSIIDVNSVKARHYRWMGEKCNQFDMNWHEYEEKMCRKFSFILFFNMKKILVIWWPNELSQVTFLSFIL